MTHEEKILDSIEILQEIVIVQKLPDECMTKGGIHLPDSSKREHLGIAKVIKIRQLITGEKDCAPGDFIWFAEYSFVDLAPLNERKNAKGAGDLDYPDYGYLKIKDIIGKAKADSAYGQMIEGEPNASKKTT